MANITENTPKRKCRGCGDTFAAFEAFGGWSHHCLPCLRRKFGRKFKEKEK